MPESIYTHFLYPGSLFYLPAELVFNSSRDRLVQGSPQETAIAKGVMAAAEVYLPQLKGKLFPDISKKFGTHLEEIDAYRTGITVGMEIALGTIYSLTSNIDELALLFYEAQEKVDGLPYFAFLQNALIRSREIAESGTDPWQEVISLAHDYRTDLYYRVGITVGEISFRATRKTFKKLLEKS